MPLPYGGLVKLLEETGELMKEVGELQQVAAKNITYFDTDDHPDGNGSLKERLENEIADAIAISTYISGSLGLDKSRIEERIAAKLRLYEQWHKEEC